MNRTLMVWLLLGAAFAAPAHALCDVDSDSDDDYDFDVDVQVGGGEHRSGDNSRLGATLQVGGAVTFRMNVIAADVVITPGSPKQVTVRVEDSGGRAVKLIPGSGGRVSADFDGPLREGMVYVELPQGSHIELDDLSGDVAVRGVGGNVRVRATSGDLVIERPGSVDLRTVSGDVAVSDAKGQVRVRTVSGDAKVRMAAGPAARFEFDSTSGDLIFGGACGAGCRLEARSCSGDMVLGMDPASSFDLSYLSHQGDFSDGLHLAALPGPKDAERSVKRRYGHGEGLIEIETYSGDVQVRRQ